jgi:pyroglutamyl-peptidase
MRPVLVTGFEPFGGEPENASQAAVLALGSQAIAGRPVIATILPCVFGEAIRTLQEQIDRADPEVVICVGQAGGRPGISLERIAINIDDARIADNAGARPIDRPIVEGGPAAYWSTLPVKAIASALGASGIDAEVSHSAGTFVCNHTFYGLMRALAPRQSVRGGFIHVPFLPVQAKRHGPMVPSMPLEQITRGLELAIRTSLITPEDLNLPGGALH